MTKEIESQSPTNEISFSSKIIHEFKTPIHSIEGITEYLQKNWQCMENATRERCLDTISSSAQTLSSLLGFLLDMTHYSQDITFNFKEVDIVDVTQKVIKSCADMHIDKPNINIELKSNLDKCFISADSFWYKRLLTNLISNAIFYSGSGIVLVQLETRKIKAEDCLIVLVQDEGNGIPQAELDSIFDPFNRGSKEHSHPQGFGIGLSICREIASAHNGTITAYNNPDTGATFEFSMPINH